MIDFMLEVSISPNSVLDLMEASPHYSPDLKSSLPKLSLLGKLLLGKLVTCNERTHRCYVFTNIHVKLLFPSERLVEEILGDPEARRLAEESKNANH